MNLRTRIAAFVAFAVGLTVVVVAFAAYRSTRSEAIDEIDASLRGRVPLGELVERRGPPGPRGGEGVVEDDVVAQILFGDGTVVPVGFSGVLLPATPLDLEIARHGGREVLRTVRADGVPYRMITRPIAEDTALQVGRDLTESEAILDGLRNRLLLIGLAGAVLAAAVGWLLAGRLLRPVRDLTRAAESVAATGDLDAAIPVDRQDEVGRLAATFNAMLERLDRSQEAQRRLVTDASHELRTPLTSLRTNIELLAADAVDGADRAELLADLRAEVVELGTLMGELVDLATIGREEEPAITLDLGTVVEEVVARARRRTGHAIKMAGTEVEVEGHPAAIGRAISNLVENAAKWSPADGRITVRFDERRLVVLDEGPGFAEDDLPHVFERFYKSPQARALPGSGLGLAIVAAVAEEYGWTVFARNRDRGGAEVGIWFEGTIDPLPES